MKLDFWVQPEIVTIGPLNIDLIVTSNAPVDASQLINWKGLANVHLRVAGAAGYVTQNLARLGLKVGILSTVSDDAFGNEIVRVLRDAQIDAARLQIESGTTTSIAIYMLLFGSKKRPLTYTEPTHFPWPTQFSSDDLNYIKGARHLHLAGYLHFPQMWDDRITQVFQYAKVQGLTTSLDPQFTFFPVDVHLANNLAQLLKLTDLLLLDEDEARYITGKDDLHSAGWWLREAGARTVVIKRGAEGSMILDKEGEFNMPALSITSDEIVDEVGAGDAYDAGFIYGMLSAWPLEKSAAFATATAAATLHGIGGTDALGTIDEILEVVTKIIPCQ
jgi:sugar/nucleoside kinase (ribokinase family)